MCAPKNYKILFIFRRWSLIVVTKIRRVIFGKCSMCMWPRQPTCSSGKTDGREWRQCYSISAKTMIVSAQIHPILRWPLMRYVPSPVKWSIVHVVMNIKVTWVAVIACNPDLKTSWRSEVEWNPHEFYRNIMFSGEKTDRKIPQYIVQLLTFMFITFPSQPRKGFSHYKEKKWSSYILHHKGWVRLRQLGRTMTHLVQVW